MKLIAEWILPIITVSELNCHEHWRIAHSRHTKQKNAVKLRYLQERGSFAPPAHIVLTRLSPRTLDSDAIGGALKWVRDALADCIIPGLKPGRADDAKYGLTWQTGQEIAKIRGVKIQIFSSLDPS